MNKGEEVGLLLRVHLQVAAGKHQDRVKVIQILGVVFEFLLGQHFCVGADGRVPQAGLLAEMLDNRHGMRDRLMAIALFLTQNKQVLLSGWLPNSQVAQERNSDKPGPTSHFHKKQSFTKTMRRLPLLAGSLRDLQIRRSEDELAANLTDACGSGVGGLTELAAIRIANYVSEVSVVEDVEELDAQVEGCSLRNFRVFLHP